MNDQLQKHTKKNKKRKEKKKRKRENDFRSDENRLLKKYSSRLVDRKTIVKIDVTVNE